jgi:hypothetical protein
LDLHFGISVPWFGLGGEIATPLRKMQARIDKRRREGSMSDDEPSNKKPTPQSIPEKGEDSA